MTTTWAVTLKTLKRASMKAAPRSAEVTMPCLLIFATGSLLDMNNARLVTSRSVPSE